MAYRTSQRRPTQPSASSDEIYNRDSSAVRQLFARLGGAVGRQSALHKESSGFAAATLRRHISTFRGYRILFSIRNLI
jgi:hypothetical protein